MSVVSHYLQRYLDGDVDDDVRPILTARARSYDPLSMFRPRQPENSKTIHVSSLCYCRRKAAANVLWPEPKALSPTAPLNGIIWHAFSCRPGSWLEWALWKELGWNVHKITYEQPLEVFDETTGISIVGTADIVYHDPDTDNIHIIDVKTTSHDPQENYGPLSQTNVHHAMQGTAYRCALQGQDIRFLYIFLPKSQRPKADGSSTAPAALLTRPFTSYDDVTAVETICGSARDTLSITDPFTDDPIPTSPISDWECKWSTGECRWRERCPTGRAKTATKSRRRTSSTKPSKGQSVMETE